MADQIESGPVEPLTFNDGTPITIETLNSFSMTVLTSVMNGFTQQEQSIVQNCFSDVRQELFNLQPNTNIDTTNMDWRFPLQFDSLDILPSNAEATHLNSSFFYKKPNVTDHYCPIEFDPIVIVQLFNNRILQGSTAPTATNANSAFFNIPLERRTDNEPSIFSTQFAEFIMNLNFNGEVYYPPQDLSAGTPSSGFLANEDVNTIWGDISAKLLKSIIYWKLPGLKQALSGTCPVVCRTC